MLILQSVNTTILHENLLQGKNANFYYPYYLPIPLGFDSSRRMLSELAGNISIDSLSSKKYWHFIRCGDSTLTMEVALNIRATMCITKEDVFGKKSLLNLISEITDHIQYRRERQGHWSGIILLSDGLLENHPDIHRLKTEIFQIEKAAMEEFEMRMYRGENSSDDMNTTEEKENVENDPAHKDTVEMLEEQGGRMGIDGETMSSSTTSTGVVLQQPFSSIQPSSSSTSTTTRITSHSQHARFSFLKTLPPEDAGSSTSGGGNILLHARAVILIQIY